MSKGHFGPPNYEVLYERASLGYNRDILSLLDQKYNTAEMAKVLALPEYLIERVLHVLLARRRSGLME